MWDLIVSVPDHCSSFYFMQTTVFVKKKKKLMPRMRGWCLNNRIENVIFCLLSNQIKFISHYRKIPLAIYNYTNMAMQIQLHTTYLQLYNI